MPHQIEGKPPPLADLFAKQLTTGEIESKDLTGTSST
jgi:hypothetical protein